MACGRCTPARVNVPWRIHGRDEGSRLWRQIGGEHAARSSRSLAWELFLLSFAALFLELMVIRWVPEHAPVRGLLRQPDADQLVPGAGHRRDGERAEVEPVPLVPAAPGESNIAAILLCRYVVDAGQRERSAVLSARFPARSATRPWCCSSC